MNEKNIFKAVEVEGKTRFKLEEIIERICFPEAEAAKESDIRKRFDTFSENFVVAS